MNHYHYYVASIWIPDPSNSAIRNHCVSNVVLEEPIKNRKHVAKLREIVAERNIGGLTEILSWQPLDCDCDSLF